MATLSDPAVTALTDPSNYATVTTVNADESLTSSIIWFNVEDGNVLVNGAEGRRWTGNLERDGRIALVISDPQNPYEYVEVRGTAARATDTTDDADDHIDRLAKRYLDQDAYPFRSETEVRVKYAVSPTIIRHQKQG